MFFTRKQLISACIIIGVLLLAGCGKPDAQHTRIVAPTSTMVAFTGSMQPYFKGGEAIHIDPIILPSVREGDIIVYWEEARQINIVHRVIHVGVAANGERYLVCKGDANSIRDLHVVTADMIVGIVTKL